MPADPREVDPPAARNDLFHVLRLKGGGGGKGTKKNKRQRSKAPIGVGKAQDSKVQDSSTSPKKQEVISRTSRQVLKP